MANKKLGTAASELKLPAKKVKGEKKPKWQGKIGKGKVKQEEVVAAEATKQVLEAAEAVIEQPASVTEQTLETPAAETAQEPHVQEPAPEPTTVSTAEEPAPAINPEPTPKKPKKLKVKANLKPKKMSMMAAALQVLQEHKEPMTCPELIDVMATEGLWTSPGGKTPAATLYAAISRSIKDLGKAAAFRKTERGKFEGR